MELRSGRVLKRKDKYAEKAGFRDRLQAWNIEKLPIRDTEGQVLFEFRRDKYHDVMRFIALTGQHVGALMEMTPKLHDEVDDVGRVVRDLLDLVTGWPSVNVGPGVWVLYKRKCSQSITAFASAIDTREKRDEMTRWLNDPNGGMMYHWKFDYEAFSRGE